MCSDEEARDRTRRLYRFVKGLVELRHIPVRKYPKEDLVLLVNLPDKPDCWFIGRGDFEDEDQESWLDVRCPRIDRHPEPPPILAEWLDPSQLADATLDFPPLLSSTTLDSEGDEDEGDENDGVEEATDASELAETSPEPPAVIQETWEAYVETEWRPWKQRTVLKYRAKRLYDDLFRMYQRQEHLGETFEIVIGFGLLTWRPTPAVEIQRHLVTANLALELDARRQILSLRPVASGVDLHLEEDMLDPTLRPVDEIRKGVTTQLQSGDWGVWDSDRIQDVLKEYCYGLSADAVFDDSFAPPLGIGGSPFVSFTPAIILRKRGNEGLLGLIDSIIKALDDGAPIPQSVIRQVCIVDESGHMGDDTATLADQVDEEIYFPLPANKEQCRIVDQLRHANGVVVEGPPGTGKSQTIANLVCHLLATGNRVLVTSHTARALQVLRDKIPEPMRPLCVQALSNDTKGMEALEYSVKGITDRYLTWDSADAGAGIGRLRSELCMTRERLQKAILKQRAIREAEVYEHSEIAGYSGTLAQVAQRLNDEREKLGHIPDAVPLDAEIPCGAADFRSLLMMLRGDGTHADGPLNEPPELSQFIPPSEFERSVRELNTLSAQSEVQGATAAIVARLDTTQSAYSIIPCANCGRRLRVPNRAGTFTCRSCGTAFKHAPMDSQWRALAADVADFRTRLNALLQRHHEDWIHQATQDIFGGGSRVWRGRLSDSQNRLAALRNLPGAALGARVTGHEGQDFDGLSHKAQMLIDRLHRRKDKALGWRLLMPGDVKDAVRVLSGVFIDGVPCTHLDQLELFVQWAEASRLLDRLEREWGDTVPVSTEAFSRRIERYEDACEPLIELLQLSQIAVDLGSVFQKTYGDPGPNWCDENELSAYIRAFEAIDARVEFDFKCKELSDRSLAMASALSGIGDSGIQAEFNTAVARRDIDGYRRAYEALASLRRNWEKKNAAAVVMRSVAELAPELANELKRSPEDSSWDALADRWDAVWSWAKAWSWLSEMVAPGAETSAKSRVAEEQIRIQTLLAELASATAWYHCFGRLTENERVHLQAWTAAVKRGGKLTGKYQNQHRRAQREHMAECQPAIPAWIMPIHRVAESIRPGDSAFDVAIVDEASQSGPEALALLFLAEKVVVVGDANQISPDPFTRVDDVNRLRAELIPDLPANDALDPQNSFFDLAKIRYPARIRLVEHFRCMPEIIQFSNDLCYKAEPLIPLRQFGAGRLEPVVQTVHVPNGFTKGKTQKVNQPEAVAIARKVAELIKDPRYANKTFGVISLLGARHAQVIENEIRSIVDASELYRRSLICGEAYAFQGDERDVMLLSMVSAPGSDSRIGVLSRGADERRFNVAMSRAKDQVWLFHSATVNDLSPKDLRTRLLRYCQNPIRKTETVSGIDLHELSALARSATRSVDKPSSPFGSWFEVDVFLKIASRGYMVIPQYEVSGYFIDIAVVGSKGKLAVECDGEFWHGAETWEADASRQRDLERCEWPFFRIRESVFRLDPDRALEPLWAELIRHGIRPAGETTEEPLEVTTFTVATEVEGPEALEVGQDYTPELFAQIGRSGAQLHRYDEWRPHPVPNPKEASRDQIIQALLEIVRVEGPATWHTVFDRYRVGLDLGRLKGPTREALEAAAKTAVRQGKLLEWTEDGSSGWYSRLVRALDCPEVRLRERGPRNLSDIPPSEIAELMRSLRVVDADEAAAFRAVLAAYGLHRLTEGAQERLRIAYQMAVQAASPR